MKQIILFITLISVMISTQACCVHIMLDPAGDARTTGRLIGNLFERGLSLQCVEQIKKQLSTQLTKSQISITRKPGDSMPTLYQATRANQLEVDLFIHLGMYQQQSARPTITIYRYGCNDDFVPTPSQPCILTIDQAHWLSKKDTQTIVNSLCNILFKDSNEQYCICGPFTLPIKPLLGISAPALMIEIGLSDPSQYTILIEPLSNAIANAL